ERSLSGEVARRRSRRRAGRLASSSMRSVWSRSKIRLSGNVDRRYVLLPVLRGPQRNADWRAGRSIRKARSILIIRESTPFWYDPMVEYSADGAGYKETLKRQ